MAAVARAAPGLSADIRPGDSPERAVLEFDGGDLYAMVFLTESHPDALLLLGRYRFEHIAVEEIPDVLAAVSDGRAEVRVRGLLRGTLELTVRTARETHVARESARDLDEWERAALR